MRRSPVSRFISFFLILILFFFVFASSPPPTSFRLSLFAAFFFFFRNNEAQRPVKVKVTYILKWRVNSTAANRFCGLVKWMERLLKETEELGDVKDNGAMFGDESKGRKHLFLRRY